VLDGGGSLPLARPGRTEYVHLTLPADAEHLRILRREVRRCLASLPMSQDRREEVLLAVSEAGANSVQHAYDPDEGGVLELTLWTESDALCVEVGDRGHWREPRPSARRTGEGGLGLVLMRQLIDCVLIHHDSRGTKVLLRHPMAEPAPDRTSLAPRHRWHRSSVRSPARAQHHGVETGAPVSSQ
jgi:anti-sigma regulatory factor (Ser/Thr protein kinase)